MLQRIDAGDSFVCSDRHLSRFPTELFVLGSQAPIKSVVLSRNDLTDTGGELMSTLTALSSLNLSRNRIARIDESLFSCCSLTVLDLSQNRIAMIAPELALLTRLHSLKLDGCALSGAESVRAICDVQTLTFLSLWNNPLLALPHPELSRLSRLVLLDLRQCQLAELPDSLFSLASLRFLKLSSNRLSEISPHIGRLSNLETLALEQCQLTALPDAVAHLVSLKFLSVSVNKLGSLPDALAVVPLQIVDFSSNPFHDAAIAQICSTPQLPLYRSQAVDKLLKERFRARLRCAASLLTAARLLLAPPRVRHFVRGRGDLALLPPHALRDILDFLAFARAGVWLIDERTDNVIVEFATKRPIVGMSDHDFARLCLFR
jgi:hypothetical protein